MFNLFLPFAEVITGFVVEPVMNDPEHRLRFPVEHWVRIEVTHPTLGTEGEFDIVTKHHRVQFSPLSYPAIVAEIYKQAAYQLVYGAGPNKCYIPSLAYEQHQQNIEGHHTIWDWTRPDCNLVLSCPGLPNNCSSLLSGV